MAERSPFSTVLQLWAEATECDVVVGQSQEERVGCKRELSGLKSLHSMTKRRQLETLIRMRNVLEPIQSRCRKKCGIIDKTGKTSPLRLGRTLSLARRIAPHVRAPPEYTDPTGTDTYCIPGFFFPCPDKAVMARATLYNAAHMRAVPPQFVFTPDAKTASIILMTFTSATKDASFFFMINNNPWQPFLPANPPYLTGPGRYTLRVYCRAEGFLPSEVTVHELDVPEPSRPGSKGEEATTDPDDATRLEVEPSQQDTLSSRTAKPSVDVFQGLFLGSTGDSEDEGSSSGSGDSESDDT